MICLPRMKQYNARNATRITHTASASLEVPPVNHYINAMIVKSRLIILNAIDHLKSSASLYAFIKANSPSLPGSALPCSIPKIPLKPFL